jgi:hypothetical protein
MSSKLIGTSPVAKHIGYVCCIVERKTKKHKPHDSNRRTTQEPQGPGISIQPSTDKRALQVKKKGPNQGRLFYVCARHDGPPPHGRCDFFQWVRLGQRTMKDFR